MSSEDIETYRSLAERTGDRLRELCDRWSREITERAEQDRAAIGEEIVEKAQSVIGKSQLLRTSKLEQFRGFLRDAERKTIGKPVKGDDIRGFWETISIQVDEVDGAFGELDRLRANDYVVTRAAAAPVAVPDSCDGPPRRAAAAARTAHPKKAVAGAAAAATASSSLKDFISAQRERRKLIVDEVPSNGHA